MSHNHGSLWMEVGSSSQQKTILHQIITIMQEHKKEGLKIPVQALYRYGAIDNGVYVVETAFFSEPVQYKHFFVYTTSQDLTGLSKVLKETSRVPWQSKGVIFELTVRHVSTPIQQEALLRKAVLIENRCTMLWYPPEDSLHLDELPDDVYLCYLDQSHVAEVNNNWPHKTTGSENFIGQQMQSNFALGLFRKNDKRMLSSVLSFHSGGLFVLFTDPEFRGKGYAEIIVKNMAKEIRQRGRIPFCTIVVGNRASENLFKKSGFKYFTEVDFLVPKRD